MKEEQIIQTLDEVHATLRGLKDEDSFMFLSDKAGGFILSGDTTRIGAHLVMAMIRYPEVREMIFRVVSRYPFLEAQVGNTVRNLNIKDYTDDGTQKL